MTNVSLRQCPGHSAADPDRAEGHSPLGEDFREGEALASENLRGGPKPPPFGPLMDCVPCQDVHDVHANPSRWKRFVVGACSQPFPHRAPKLECCLAQNLGECLACNSVGISTLPKRPSFPVRTGSTTRSTSHWAKNRRAWDCDGSRVGRAWVGPGCCWLALRHWLLQAFSSTQEEDPYVPIIHACGGRVRGPQQWAELLELPPHWIRRARGGHFCAGPSLFGALPACRRV